VKGFRYLAIETLSTCDSLIQIQKYPTVRSGYYSKELAYANFIRHALDIGFKLVSYDVDEHNVNIRDNLQAANIYKKTYNVDPDAKVIVHAGYGHIVENADVNLAPMGACLKKLLNRDVFTIDQVAMVGHNNISKRHPYYQHISAEKKLAGASVFINEDKKVLVDPVHALAVDCQVYHPEVKTTFDRPDFLFSEKTKVYALPTKLEEYTGHLLQINAANGDESAIPVDRLLLNDRVNRAVLVPGRYEGYLIAQNGTAIRKFKILAR
jgi:hypothetical protein